MQYPTPRLPLELCEQVIESFRPPDEESEYPPNRGEYQRILTLLSCARVHHSWLRCTRIHLYSLVWVHSGAALWTLRRTLQSHPGLIRRITRLIVAPRVWKSLEMTITGYLPLVPFLSMGSPVKHVHLSDLGWSHSLYGGLYQRGFSNQSVTRLEIIGVAFPSFADVIPFIASFRNVTYLALVGCYFKSQLTDHEMTQLQLLPSSYASPSLRSLEVGGEGRNVSGAHFFGDNIEHLHLFLQLSIPIPPSFDHYRLCLIRYENLQSLHLTLEPQTSVEVSTEGAHGGGVDVWGPIHRYLLELLRAITSSTVRTLEIAIIPMQQELPATQNVVSTVPAPWTLSCHYLHTLDGFIDALFSSELRDVLASPTLAHLACLCFVIRENSPARDEKWWFQQVAPRLGLRPGVFHPDVRYSANPIYASLWDSQ